MSESFLPKAKLCLKGCSLLNIYEETNPLSTNNPTGWNTITTDSIVTSYIEIFDSTGNDLIDTIVLKNSTIDVYSSVVGSPTPSNFLAIKEHVWEQGDGVFEFVYTVLVENQIGDIIIYKNSPQKVLFTCNLEKCINKLKESLIKECDSKKMSLTKLKLDQLEIIFYGIKSAFSCNNIELVNSLLEKAKVICDNICGCGCGDC